MGRERWNGVIYPVDQNLAVPLAIQSGSMGAAESWMPRAALSARVIMADKWIAMSTGGKMPDQGEKRIGMVDFERYGWWSEDKDNCSEDVVGESRGWKGESVCGNVLTSEWELRCHQLHLMIVFISISSCYVPTVASPACDNNLKQTYANTRHHSFITNLCILPAGAVDCAPGGVCSSSEASSRMQRPVIHCALCTRLRMPSINHKKSQGQRHGGDRWESREDIGMLCRTCDRVGGHTYTCPVSRGVGYPPWQDAGEGSCFDSGRRPTGINYPSSVPNQGRVTRQSWPLQRLVQARLSALQWRQFGPVSGCRSPRQRDPQPSSWRSVLSASLDLPWHHTYLLSCKSTSWRSWGGDWDLYRAGLVPLTPFT